MVLLRLQVTTASYSRAVQIPSFGSSNCQTTRHFFAEIPRWQARRDLLAAGAAGEYCVHRFYCSRTDIPIHCLSSTLLDSIQHTHTNTLLAHLNIQACRQLLYTSSYMYNCITRNLVLKCSKCPTLHIPLDWFMGKYCRTPPYFNGKKTWFPVDFSFHLLSHIIPHYPISSHIIPYYPILSHFIPYYPISSHIKPIQWLFKRGHGTTGQLLPGRCLQMRADALDAGWNFCFRNINK